MVCAPAAALIQRTLGVPFVVYVYADEISATPAVARFAMRHAERTIAISAHTHQLALEAGGPPERMVRILPGVDLPDVVERHPTGQPTILTIASMAKRYKGHDVMIRALPLIRARVPDAHWVVVGSGPLEPLYRKWVEDAGLDDAVDFCGFVDAAERDRWLSSADVIAMPSRLRPDGGGGEGFGIVYLEAGAHGMPVVGGDVGGALDAVREGRPACSSTRVITCRSRTRSPTCCSIADRARRMGEAGRAWAEEHTWPRVAERVEDLLQDVLR